MGQPAIPLTLGGDAAPTVAATVPRGHLPGLDLLRGLAVLGVIFYHGFDLTSAPGNWSPLIRRIDVVTSQGFLGVELFFVLSGFLITGILLKNRSRPNFFADFYWRRLLRIIPIYVVLLVVLYATRIIDTRFLLASVLFLSNFPNFFKAKAIFVVLWSLSVEEQFYLVWPFIVRRLSTRVLAFLSAALCVFVFCLRWYLAQHGLFLTISRKTIYYTDCLAYGALIAVCLFAGYLKPKHLAPLAITAVSLGACTLALRPFLPPSSFLEGLSWAPWLWIFSGLVLLSIRRGSKHFSPRNPFAVVLQFFAYISYGLYLLHWLVILVYDRTLIGTQWQMRAENGLPCLLMRTGVCLAVSVPLAYLSRRYFEERFLRWKDRFSKPNSSQTAAPA